MNSRTAASRLPGVSNPAWFHEQAWPFETVTVETDDDVIAVSEAGRGPLLLFVHVGTWSFVWRDLMSLLAHDFRCITLDAPGNGRTRSKNAAPVTLRRASSAIGEVIEALDLENITLVLHDLGGPSGILAVERSIFLCSRNRRNEYLRVEARSPMAQKNACNYRQQRYARV